MAKLPQKITVMIPVKYWGDSNSHHSAALSWRAFCVRAHPVPQSCLTLCNPMDYSLPGSFCPQGFPGKNTGVGCHFLLQGIFPIQGSNPRLLHGQGGSFPLSHLGNPKGHLRATATVSEGLLNQGALFSSLVLHSADRAQSSTYFCFY